MKIKIILELEGSDHDDVPLQSDDTSKTIEASEEITIHSNNHLTMIELYEKIRTELIKYR